MRTIRWAAAALCAIALAQGAPAAAQGVELTVAHYGSLVQGAPYAVAMEKGFFAEAGLPVSRIVSGDGGGTTVRNVLASPFPFGEAALGAVMTARLRGQDVVAVNAAVSGPVDMFWIVKPDSPIRSLQDVKGRKIGYTNPKSGSDYLGRMVFDAAGLKEIDLTLVATGGMREGLAMLSAGQIDVMPVIEPILTTLGPRFRVAFAYADHAPPLTQTIGFTTREFAAKNGDRLRALLAARRKAVDFIYANPEETAAIVARTHDLKPEVAKAVIERYVRDRYWSRGDFDKSALDAQVKGLRLVGALDGEAPAWGQLVDASYLPADLPKPAM